MKFENKNLTKLVKIILKDSWEFDWENGKNINNDKILKICIKEVKELQKDNMKYLTKLYNLND